MGNQVKLILMQELESTEVAALKLIFGRLTKSAVLTRCTHAALENRLAAVAPIVVTMALTVSKASATRTAVTFSRTGWGMRSSLVLDQNFKLTPQSQSQ